MKGSVWPKLSISLRFLEIGPIYVKLQLGLLYAKSEVLIARSHTRSLGRVLSIRRSGTCHMTATRIEST